jgi:methyl-accepting chemotaxis protein
MMDKRSRILVEGFQARFVATEVAWLVACFSLFLVVLLGPLVWEINSGAVPASDVRRATEFLLLRNRLWMPLIALFLGVTWTLVRVSHRVAGPLYRFRQVFAQVAGGDVSVRVRVRGGDFLLREGEELDGMIGAMRDRVRRAQQAASALRRDLAELSGSTDRVPGHQIAALVARAAETEEILAGFVTEAGVTPEPATAAAARAVENMRLSLT